MGSLKPVSYTHLWEEILIMEKSLFNELTLEQKQKLLTLPAELKHFTQTQWAAIYGIVPMTQELFDSIQLERLKVGEELESAALDTFLKYPEFALNYSSRLESDLITSNTISSDDAEENFKQLYEKMRHSIYAKFQYDIGA